MAASHTATRRVVRKCALRFNHCSVETDESTCYHFVMLNRNMTEKLHMKKYRTVACVIIMAIAAIAGTACVVYAIDNHGD